MDQVRILHIMDKLSVDGSQVAGPARQIAYRVRHYNPARYAVMLCNLRADAPAAQTLREAGVDVVSLGRGKLDPRTLGDLLRLIRRWQPHVLHLSGYAAWTFGRLAGWWLRVPVVVQEHFVDPRMPAYQRVADWLLRNRQQGAIAVAEGVADFMRSARHIRRTPIEVIGNGVPVERMRRADDGAVRALRAQLGIAPEERVVGIVGRLAEMKGHTDFLQAAQRVIARLGRVAIVVVGAGPLEQALKEQAAALGIQDRVRFVGYQADVMPYLRLFDVNVIASVYGEGFPSVGLESFAAQTPVVITDLEVFRGIYEDGRNVLMVPARNAQAMAEAVSRVLAEPELARALVQGGLTTLARFDTATVAQRYLAYYERVLAAERPGAGRAPQAPGICVLIELFHPIVGGGETYVRNITSRLAAQGLRVSIVTRRVRPEFAPRERLDGVEVHRVPPSGMPRFGKYLMIPWAVAKLVQLRRTYDVIYVSNFRVLGPVGLLVARLLGKRCVLRAGICGEFSGRYVAENGMLPTRALSWLATPLTLRMALLRRADGFVSNCEAITREFTDGGVPRERIAWLPGGVDTARFAPLNGVDRSTLRARLGLPTDRYLIGYSGKLSRGKGVNHLLAALPGILRRAPDAHVVLIGSGQHQFLSQETALRAMVKTLQVEDRVTFTGFVENVPEYLRSLDLYVLPTEFEALPNALMEAMACGLPCVATRVGGIPDLITDGVNGRLVAPASPEALERAVLEVRNDQGLAATWRVAARQTIEARFSLEVLARRHQEFLAALCNGAGQPKGR